MTDTALRPRRRGNKRELTRARLVEAAVAVAEERGLAAASLDEIATRAGMTKGAIYSNFEGKADLVMAVAEAHGLRLAPAYTPDAPLRTQLTALAEAVIAALPIAQTRSRLSAELQAYAAIDADLRGRFGDLHRAMFARWSRTLAETYGDELAMPPLSLVVTLQALATGLAHQHQLTPELVTPQVVRDAFEALADGASSTRDRW